MPDHARPAAPGTYVTISILMLAAMTVMANATIAPSLPGLRERYADVAGIDTLAGLGLTLPSLAVALTAGLAGWLADRVDRQKLLLTSGVLYAVGGTSGLLVDGLAGLLAGRAVLGVGVAGTMVLATTWAADLWQGEARARFLGRQGAATSAGGIAVILIGGSLASLHWRGAFAAYLLVVPVVLLALRALRPYARMRRRMPRADAADSAPATPFPWRTFAVVGTLAFLLMVAFFVVPTRLPFLLAEVGVNDPLLLGAVISLVTVAALPGGLAYGRIRAQVSPTGIFALSYALMGLGMLVLGFASSLAAMALGVVLVGLGLGPAVPNNTATLMAVVPEASRGRASGLLTTAFFAGQFVSPLVTAPLVNAMGLPGAFRALALAQMALAAGLAVAALRAKRRPALA